jgi:peptidoglycan/LPS O-acetylase OafA/YrhL
MALAVASVELSRRPGVAQRVARYSWLGWVLAAAAFLAICRGLGLSGENIFTTRPTVAQDLAVYVLSGVVAFGVILPAAFERKPAGLLGRILGARPVAWLGLVSYGIFLYHLPIATKLNGGVTTSDATVRFLWLTAATTALAIAAGAASYYVIERPVLRFKERRIGRVRRASVAG